MATRGSNILNHVLSSGVRRGKGPRISIQIARFFHPPRLEISIVLHSHSDHQSIADGDDDAERENGGGDASGQEMLHLEVADACLRHFHHDRSCKNIVSDVSVSFCSQDGWIGKRD